MPTPAVVWSGSALYDPDPATLTVPSLTVSAYAVLFWQVTNSIVSGFGRHTDFAGDPGTILHDDVGIPGAPNGDDSAFYCAYTGSGGTITWGPGGAFSAAGSIAACVVDFGIPYTLVTNYGVTGGANPLQLPNLSPYTLPPTNLPPTFAVALYAKGGAAGVTQVDPNWLVDVDLFAATGPQTNRQQLYHCDVQASLWDPATPAILGPGFTDGSGGRPAVASAVYFLPLIISAPVRRRPFAWVIG